MNFSEAQLLSWINSFLLPLFRIAAFISVVPVLSMGAVPMRIRLIFSLLLTLAIAPLVPDIIVFDALSVDGMLIIFQQIMIGLVMGFSLQLVFAAIVNGGQLVGMQMGLGFAQMMDPSSGVTVPAISQLYNLLGILLFLAINGHLVLIDVLANSFQTLPIGAGGIVIGNLWDLVAMGGWIFSGAVLIALPAVTSLLMVSMLMGVITKASPQMNIFSVGFSITIVLGFVIILVTLSTAIPRMTQLFDQGFLFMHRLLIP